MAEATIPRAEAPGRLIRFDRPERNVHWFTAALVGVTLLSAAALYVAPLAALVGRRSLIKDIHVVAGLALPLPWLIVRLGPWATQLRSDTRRLNRFDDHDRRWVRTLGRDPLIQRGKFNAGQKLNAAFTVGALLLLLATGSIMKWFGPFPLAWRTGATFVHDWTATALLIVLIGHIAKAFGDREALAGMVEGTVSARWAARKAPRWLAEHEGHPPKG
jgi:formate dehydrogenase subunit gamma